MRASLLGSMTFISSALCLAACADDASVPREPAPLIQPVVRVPGAVTPVTLSAIVQRYDMSRLSGAPLGVTVDPGTGQRLVLTNANAIHDLDAETAEPLWTGAPLTNPAALFTDLAALGDGRVALTSWSDGYLVDLPSGVLSLHFCYEPGWWEPTGNDPIQLSFSVAHDAAAELIYAQPRTIDAGGSGPTTENFVASYDEATGADLDWWAIDDLDFSAGGIAVLPGDGSTGARILMGQGSELFVFDTSTDEMTPLASVSNAGVLDIGGLAIDAENRTLLIAAPSSLEVVELRLEALGL